MCLYVHCQFSVFPLSQLCASRRNNVPCSNNDRFLRVERFYYQNSLAKWRDMFDPSVFPPVFDRFDPCTVVFCLLCLTPKFYFLSYLILLQSFLVAYSFFLFKVLCFASASEADADRTLILLSCFKNNNVWLRLMSIKFL